MNSIARRLAAGATTAALLVLTASFVATQASSEPGTALRDSARDTPRFDPFVPAIASGTGPRSAVWSPELRATLVGNSSPVANLGGEILRVGEQTHGYTLLEVQRNEAVFSKDGQRIVLKLVEKSKP